jgi:hypothetical protein
VTAQARVRAAAQVAAPETEQVRAPVTAQARVRAAALVAAQVAAPETERVRAPVTAVQARVRAAAQVAETVWAQAAVLERVQARVVVRAAVGKGLPTHPRSDIMIGVWTWCLNRISSSFSGQSSDLPHEMGLLDKQTTGRDEPRRN